MHPSLEIFTRPPVEMHAVTVVICSHAYHGTITYYLPVDEFQDAIKLIIPPCWINAYNVFIYPAAT